MKRRSNRVRRQRYWFAFCRRQQNSTRSGRNCPELSRPAVETGSFPESGASKSSWKASRQAIRPLPDTCYGVPTPLAAPLPNSIHSDILVLPWRCASARSSPGNARRPSRGHHFRNSFRVRLVTAGLSKSFARISPALRPSWWISCSLRFASGNPLLTHSRTTSHS